MLSRAREKFKRGAGFGFNGTLGNHQLKDPNGLGLLGSGHMFLQKLLSKIGNVGAKLRALNLKNFGVSSRDKICQYQESLAKTLAEETNRT